MYNLSLQKLCRMTILGPEINGLSYILNRAVTYHIIKKVDAYLLFHFECLLPCTSTCMCDIVSSIEKYTHRNKLGNTFIPCGKFEKIHFSFFWR